MVIQMEKSLLKRKILLILLFEQVLANDTYGLEDRARVFIYLLREDQRVRFVLRQHPPEIRNKIETFRE